MYQLWLTGTEQLPEGETSVFNTDWDFFTVEKTSESLEELEKIMMLHKLSGKIHEGHIVEVCCDQDVCDCDNPPIHHIQEVFVK